MGSRGIKEPLASTAPKLMFKERFDALPQTHRLALAITFSERRLTHARLSELTELHPSDVTKALRELINQEFLVSEGSGRGTIYRFKGSQKITSDDVFSDTSSPDLDTTYPDLDTSSPDLNRNADGLLISKYHELNFVDDLTKLSDNKRKELVQLARLPIKKAKIPRDEMIEVILKLCSGHYITLNALSKLVNRNPNGLRDSYITNLRKERKLKLAFQDSPNDERQAYTRA